MKVSNLKGSAPIDAFEYSDFISNVYFLHASNDFHLTGQVWHAGKLIENRFASSDCRFRQWCGILMNEFSRSGTPSSSSPSLDRFLLLGEITRRKTFSLYRKDLQVHRSQFRRMAGTIRPI